MTLGEAESLIADFVGRAEIGVYEDLCRQTNYGWVIYWNSRAYIETGDFMYSLVGNAPVIVVAATRTVHATSSAEFTNSSIAELESKLGLIP